jgi:hypothetical protein
MKLAVPSGHAWTVSSNRQEVAMRGSGLAADDLRCIEFFSVVTDDLDGEANEDDRRRINKHLEPVRRAAVTLTKLGHWRMSS